MLKNILLLSVLVISIVTFAFFSNLMIGDSTFTLAKVSPTPTKNVSIKSVKLDKDNVVIRCPDYEKFRPTEGESCSSKERSEINISTELTENDENLEIYYIVSTGEIIGKGKNVVWQFPNSLEGEHTLTVGIGKDGIIIGETKTKTIELRHCTCDPPPCVCGDLEMNLPRKQLKAGDTFLLSVKSSESDKVLYTKWTIQGGEIVNGQGTKKVLVRIPQNSKDKKLIATVIAGTTCEDCVREIMEEIKITK